MNRSSSTKSTKAGEDKVTTTLLSTSQIPIIDLAHMGTDECPVKHVVNRVATQLSKALQNKGLAILVNHGIPEEKLKEAWKYLDGFCNLPADVKDVYLRKTGNNHGYVKPVAENVGKPKELRHAFNICTVSGASLPEEPMPGFQDLIADLTKDFKNLASLLLQALAVALDVPLDFFLEKHDHMLSGTDENETTLRLLYYPPIVEDDNTCELVQKNMSYSYQRCASHALQLDKIVVDDDDEADGPKEGNGESSENDWMKKHRGVTRCGAAHCDFGTFTLLCQDAEGGLEAKLPGTERWQRVGHLPGSILINAGELLSMWTNDKFPALPHRVVIPEQPAIKLKGRHSMAFFVHPDNDTEIVPLGTQVPVDQKETNGTDLKKKKTIQTRFITAYQHIQRKFKQQTD